MCGIRAVDAHGWRVAEHVQMPDRIGCNVVGLPEQVACAGIRLEINILVRKARDRHGVEHLLVGRIGIVVVFGRHVVVLDRVASHVGDVVHVQLGLVLRICIADHFACCQAFDRNRHRMGSFILVGVVPSYNRLIRRCVEHGLIRIRIDFHGLVAVTIQSLGAASDRLARLARQIIDVERRSRNRTVTADRVVIDRVLRIGIGLPNGIQADCVFVGPSHLEHAVGGRGLVQLHAVGGRKVLAVTEPRVSVGRVVADQRRLLDRLLALCLGGSGVLRPAEQLVASTRNLRGIRQRHAFLRVERAVLDHMAVAPGARGATVENQLVLVGEVPQHQFGGAVGIERRRVDSRALLAVDIHLVCGTRLLVRVTDDLVRVLHLVDRKHVALGYGIRARAVDGGVAHVHRHDGVGEAAILMHQRAVVEQRHFVLVARQLLHQDGIFDQLRIPYGIQRRGIDCRHDVRAALCVEQMRVFGLQEEFVQGPSGNALGSAHLGASFASVGVHGDRGLGVIGIVGEIAHRRPADQREALPLIVGTHRQSRRRHRQGTDKTQHRDRQPHH